MVTATLLILTRATRRNFSRSLWPGAAAGILFSLTAAAAEPHPLAAPDNFQLHPAFQLSLFAAEPEVVDPVALTFDEFGRAYVVEMRDYPLGLGPEHRPGGTIRLLEDTDGDGRADRSTVFAENLSVPTSILAWNGGVLVVAPPEILFLKDTDGDGKADVREVVVRGLRKSVTDSNASGLRWGLDNRVHAVNGGNGGSVSSPRAPDRVTPLRKLDFSFDPATGDLATTFQTGGGFGLVFDDWGRSFTPYNINHLLQRMLPERYLNRFPGLPPLETTVSISDHEEMARVFPISIPETRVNHPEQAGRFSSAGGVGFLGLAGLPGDLAGSVTVCDVVGNLVHRDVLRADGPGFVASRAPEETTREFFASRDNACRPVALEPGPDGALYLLDMQRDVIEHPDYIPAKVKEKINLRAGEDRGRIYRLTLTNAPALRQPLPGRMSREQLVTELASPNQWRRVTAQRLLVTRHELAAVPLLQQLATTGAEPLGRLHALWTLQGLGALDESVLRRGLADAHPGVRENALLLAETWGVQRSPAVAGQIVALAADPSARVRFQTALTLGELDSPAVTGALLQIVRQDFRHFWSRLAVLSSLRQDAAGFISTLVADAGFRSASDAQQAALIRELADLVGARALREPAGLPQLLAALSGPSLPAEWSAAALDGLQSGLARLAAVPPGDTASAAALDRLESSGARSQLAAIWKIRRALGLPASALQQQSLAEAARVAQDGSRPAAGRVEALQWLALGPFAAGRPALLAALSGTQPAAVQSAAIETLASFNEPGIADALLAHWRELTPAVRAPVIDLLLHRRSYHGALLGAVEQGRIQVGELNLDLEQRRRLLRDVAPEIQARAAKFWGDEEYSNRKSLVTDWLAKLPATGEAGRGQAVFEKTCTPCHRVAGLGNAVGPDLTEMSHRSVEDLLSNILDPNMAINPAFLAFTAEWTPDESATGILQAETPEAVTLLQAQGVKVVIPRAKLKRLESSGLSLMPEGLEAGLTPQALRDLIAFLQAAK